MPVLAFLFRLIDYWVSFALVGMLLMLAGYALHDTWERRWKKWFPKRKTEEPPIDGEDASRTPSVEDDAPPPRRALDPDEVFRVGPDGRPVRPRKNRGG